MVRHRRRLLSLLAVSLMMVLFGGALAAWTQSDGGNVAIKDTRFIGADGQQLSALLYIPSTATAKTPAPAVLAVHGYINSRETQDAFAIELARRGYVVMALDQSGHGFSDGAAFANGYGGPAALAYLHSLDIVDKNNIGLEGHSMGGWTIASAAYALPDMYKSMVMVGSSFGPPYAPPLDTYRVQPKNVAFVYGRWEEFSALMYGVGNPKDANASPAMEGVFGTNQAVQEGRIYGNVADGTARVLYRPNSTHPGLTMSPDAVARTVDWFDQTLDGARPVGGQTWWLKELGTLIALAGGLLFLFPFAGLLLETPYFAALRRTPREAMAQKATLPWRGAVLIAATVPAATYFWFNVIGTDHIKASGAWPQTVSSGIMMWALLNGLITVVLFAVWHLLSGRRAGLGARDYGLWAERFGVRMIGRAALLATGVAAGLYALLAMSDWLFKTDFRFYVVQLHLMDAAHLRVFLTYLIPFTAFMLTLSLLLHGQLRLTGRPMTLRRELTINALIGGVGLLVLILVDYLPLLTGHTLWVSTQPLLVIVAYQFVPLLAVVAMVSTYLFHKTGTIYAGAFLNGIWITWQITAGTANQYAVQPWGGSVQWVRVGVPIVVAAVLAVVAFRGFRAGGADSDLEAAVPEGALPGPRPAHTSEHGPQRERQEH